ncbi:MAG: hypothetical protein NZL87_07805, partial [Thermomicrobium sp.]|nr:hypothetical protein [Thermomicrobium sp.]
LVIRRAHDGWHTETRFWIVEDLAEHQRLRVRRGSAPTLAELRELLSEAGLPPDLVTTVVESTAALETSTAV